ncbi:MAG: hypothetical protein QE263_02755 [Vampirovibrionales bacterium]|nr:hypothetical protein [Vampirovibrionales bacterium]
MTVLTPSNASPAAGVTANATVYTLGYLKETLQTDEGELMALADALQLQPEQEEATGQWAFQYRQVQVLRKAVELNRRGESLKAIQDLLGPTSTMAAAAMPAVVLTPDQQLSAQAKTLRSQGSTGIAVVVDAIANARTDILKDMGRLIDDKLAGLDEVVVELIRAKSENDALKQKIASLQEERDILDYELGRFKETGFGFYRKTT